MVRQDNISRWRILCVVVKLMIEQFRIDLVERIGNQYRVEFVMFNIVPVQIEVNLKKFVF